MCVCVCVCVCVLALHFWVMTSCTLVCGYQRFARTCPSTLKMEAAYFSEMFVSTYKGIWYHKPQDHSLNLHRCVGFGCVVAIPVLHGCQCFFNRSMERG
jgi:hypothetical protein